jgi:hypothetical protein
MSWDVFLSLLALTSLVRHPFITTQFICSLRWHYNGVRRSFVAGVWNSVWGLCHSLHDEGIDSVSRKRRTLFSKFPDPLWGPLRRCSGVLGTISPEVRLLGLGALLPLYNVPSWHTRGLHVDSVTYILCLKCNVFFRYPRQFSFTRSYPFATY